MSPNLKYGHAAPGLFTPTIVNRHDSRVNQLRLKMQEMKLISQAET